jgi:hypothetical protein
MVRLPSALPLPKKYTYGRAGLVVFVFVFVLGARAAPVRVGIRRAVRLTRCCVLPVVFAIEVDPCRR